MLFKDFFYNIDPRLSITISKKPYWEIVYSEVHSFIVKDIERGSDPYSFVKQLEGRGNTPDLVKLRFESVRATPCCSTITMLGYNDYGKIITKVNFNLRIKPLPQRL